MKVVGLFSEDHLNNELMSKLLEERIIVCLNEAVFENTLKDITEGIVLCDELFFLKAHDYGELKRVIQSRDTMVIVLCKDTRSSERVQLLNNGADNVWSYDFHPSELHARIMACLRFFKPFRGVNSSSIKFDDLLIDQEQKQVFISGAEVLLTATEYEILLRMATHPKRIYEREELMEIAGTSDEGSTLRVIDTHVKNLRKKIEKDPARPRFIKTVHGRGYRFEPEEEEE